ncbi:MAG: hypothetical protein IJM57_08325 [Lachnospiraceae bacterium]|nr:hypothetical protein [Lachnospiraceae bacterium]
MKLKTVGFYKEMSQGRETDKSIYECLHKEKDCNIEKICSYLNQGIAFIVSPGNLQDVIRPENGISGVATAYTDGEWLWPGDLSYYVRKYALKLPEQFVETMQKNGWKVSFKLNEEDCNTVEIDGVNIFE